MLYFHISCIFRSQLPHGQSCVYLQNKANNNHKVQRWMNLLLQPIMKKVREFVGTNNHGKKIKTKCAVKFVVLFLHLLTLTFAPMGRGLRNVSAEIQEKLRKPFNTAYFVGKENYVSSK